MNPNASALSTPREQVLERLRQLEADQAQRAERDRLKTRGAAQLGYYLDLGGMATMRLSGHYAPTWRRQGAAAARPARIPEADYAQALDAADCYAQASQAKAFAHRSAELLDPAMPDLLRATEAQRITYEPDAAYTRATAALEDAALRLGRQLVAVERLDQAEQAAPARRAAAERTYQQQIAAIDAELDQARQSLAALGI